MTTAVAFQTRHMMGSNAEYSSLPPSFRDYPSLGKDSIDIVKLETQVASPTKV